MGNTTIKINLEPAAVLDKRALLIRQPYNLGNKNDWFGCFCGGLSGFHSRVYGFEYHYNLIHSSSEPLQFGRQWDFHVSDILFNMDSSIECLTFALNALGYCINEQKFKDISNAKGLRAINPYNIIGTTNQAALVGYRDLFPELQKFWCSNVHIVDAIIEQHDVSKHREGIFIGGKCKDAKEITLAMEEIELLSEPKLPLTQRNQNTYKLENLSLDYKKFIEKSLSLILQDVQKIKLTHETFI